VSRFRASPGTDGRPRTAVFSGSDRAAKGVLDAIEAINLANAGTSAPRWRLVLAGDIPGPEFADRIAALVRASGGAIHLAGFVSGAAKHKLLAEAGR